MYKVTPINTSDPNHIGPDRFWEIVSKVGWGRHHTDSKRGKSVLKKELPSVEAMEDFRETCRFLRTHLDDIVTDYEKQNNVSCGLGDDGFNDLLNHIIGLGREEYIRVLEDPSLAIKRGVENKFTESFSYCIPYPSDY